MQLYRSVEGGGPGATSLLNAEAEGRDFEFSSAGRGRDHEQIVFVNNGNQRIHV